MTIRNHEKGTPWLPLRHHGLERLSAFVPRAGACYAKKRNFDLGPGVRSNVSLLSPWLRHRLILEPEVLRATLEAHQEFSASEKFIQEVFWRTYYKGWLQLHPQIWTRYRADLENLLNQLDLNSSLRNRYHTAIEGRTGIDCFDAWTQELVEWGYLHNHARMWFASIWIFTLELPWQLGADFFYRHLLDGDPASNTLSWRWVAGLHTKGKTYLARANNIARYTQGRFNPEGILASTAQPLEEPDVGSAASMPCSARLPEDKSYGLLITEEDCFPESLPIHQKPAALLGLCATQSRSPLPISPIVEAFTAGAITDALNRAVATFNVKGVQGDGDNWGQLLTDWVQDLNLRVIVSAFAPVGPVAERLSTAKPSLEKAGIRLVQVLRPYDIYTWPHATKGFFKLENKIPQILAKLNLLT